MQNLHRARPRPSQAGVGWVGPLALALRLSTAAKPRARRLASCCLWARDGRRIQLGQGCRGFWGDCASRSSLHRRRLAGLSGLERAGRKAKRWFGELAGGTGCSLLRILRQISLSAMPRA